MSLIEFRGVEKRYSSELALDNVSMAIESGCFLAVVGRSGSGKTTLLRIIAGLETPTAGEFWLDGREASKLAPHRRGMAMVFQNQALYPHLNVKENLEFGQKERGVERKVLADRLAEAVTRLELTSMLNQSPATLSGGQRQRVALARAWIAQPRILLLDEPFANLDPEWRGLLRNDLSRIHRSLGTTIVHVTHDQGEALSLGTQVAILESGRLVAFGKPRDLYQNPPNRSAAKHLGDPPINLWSPQELTNWGPRFAKAAEIGVRPEHLQIVQPGTTAPTEALLSTNWSLERSEFLGSEVRFQIRKDNQLLIGRLFQVQELPLTEGSTVNLLIPQNQILIFDSSGQRLP